MNYTESDVYNYLKLDEFDLSSFIVVLGENGVGDTLYTIREHVLFFMMINDDDMYHACVAYIKKNGMVYKNEKELKKDYP